MNLLEQAHTLAERIAPLAAGWEDARTMANADIRHAIKSGLGALLVPVDKGGHGASNVATTQVLETIAAADLPFAFSLVVHNNLANSIARRGTTAQVERYLARMGEGRVLGAFCLTEPEVGTDAAAIKTTAQRDGSAWRLDGAKAWVTNAHQADLFCIYAQTDAAAGTAGIAAFLVDRDTPGLTVEAPYRLIGCHSMGTGGLQLTNCRVEDGALFLKPGEGFKGAMAGIDLARVLLSGMCCGALASGLDVALAYAGQRQVFGRALLDFQGLQWMLADVATDLHAARLMTYDAAARLDAGEPATVAAAHTKKFTTRATMAGLTQCMQAMGAAGLRAEGPVARHFAAAKVAQYLDGTTEVQNIVIARSLRSRGSASA